MIFLMFLLRISDLGREREKKRDRKTERKNWSGIVLWYHRNILV